MLLRPGAGGELQHQSPAYDLTLVTPQTLTPDFAERPTDNDDRSRAYDLRTIEGALALSGLSIHAADQDWYRFDLPHSTAPGQSVRIDFNHAEGSLQLALFRAGGSRRRWQRLMRRELRGGRTPASQRQSAAGRRL